MGATARPRTRGECIDGPRPCPWMECRYHLDGVDSCALDVADEGPHDSTELADRLGCSPITIRVICSQVRKKLERALGAQEEHHG